MTSEPVRLKGGGFRVVGDFACERLAEEAVSGRVGVAEVARRVRSLVEDALLSGAAEMARAFVRMLPPSLFVRRVVAWHASRVSPGFRVLPVRVGESFDVGVDLWEEGPFLRELARREEVVREGCRARGSLLVFYAVAGPHGEQDVEEAMEAARRALASKLRGRGGHVWGVCLPLPPGGELGEFDV